MNKRQTALLMMLVVTALLVSAATPAMTVMQSPVSPPYTPLPWRPTPAIPTWTPTPTAVWRPTPGPEPGSWNYEPPRWDRIMRRAR